MNATRILSLVLAFAAVSTYASLTPNYTFSGNGNWSLDAVGGNGTPVGSVNAFVPAGSTVEAAFLYTNTFGGSPIGSVNFDGTILTSGDYTALGTATSAALQGFRADVTAQVAAKIGAGGGNFTFDILSESPNTSIDGSALALVYSNPSESFRTIAFLDGFTNPFGDSFFFNSANPLDPTQPGFEALLSLGISFSASQQGSPQTSTVDVNGRRLTSSAGSEDDGALANGALITIGGLGDSTDNPADPFFTTVSDPRYDDELYNLAAGNAVDSSPFINVGDTLLQLDTRNASDDDNIFFAGFNITAQGTITEIPDPVGPVVPEASTYGMIGAGALALLVVLRRFRNRR